MKLYINLLIASNFIFYSSRCVAQYFPAEQSPPSVKWEQMNTKKFRLVYPSESQEQARKLLSLLEVLQSRETKSLDTRVKKLTILFINQGVVSNGFVQLAPRKSEFYTTPSQYFDPQSWLSGLAVHEYRHAVQYDKLTGRFNFPPFETLALGVFGISLPSWFYEGDAVSTETALTQAGRGRTPEWVLQLMSNTLSGKKYSYSKNYLGSYKDITAGYYQLGYFMNTKLRRDYGLHAGDSIMNYIAANPLRPYSFSRALKGLTGMNTRRFHDSTLRELKQMWEKQLLTLDTESYHPLNKRTTKSPESYLMPAPLSNGNILAIKQGRKEADRLVEFDSSGNYRPLFFTGRQETPWFSYNANKLVWDEFRYDLRYHLRSFSVINLYSFATGKRKQLTRKSRLFAPALSPDGTRILAIEAAPDTKTFAVLLDAENGRELRRFESPDGLMLQMPSFHPDGNKAVMIAVGDKGKSLLELDLKNAVFETLLPFEHRDLSRPSYLMNDLLFKADYNGIDNIYCLDRTENAIFQMSSAKTGAYNALYDLKAGRIVCNIYQNKGFDITALNGLKRVKSTIGSARHTLSDYVQPLYLQEGGRNVLDSIPLKSYTSKPYKEACNLLNVHSLVPVAENVSLDRDYTLGLELQSNNLLNTMSLYTRYQHNYKLGRDEYLAGISYSRFFPKLSVDYANRAGLLYRKIHKGGSATTLPVSWREHYIKAEAHLPITINRYNTVYGFGLKAGTSYGSKYNIENDFKNLLHTFRFPMHYQLYASSNSRRSQHDLAPRFGQNISFTYKDSPFENRVKGRLFTVRSTFYFPGLAASHSLAASLNFRKGTGAFKTMWDIPLVSGYSSLKHIDEIKNTVLLNYRLPMFYPDWELGPLAYIKRIKGGFFADFENVDLKKRISPISYGLELTSDMNLLRFYLPDFDIGGKLIFLNEHSGKKPVVEAVLRYNY